MKARTLGPGAASACTRRRRCRHRVPARASRRARSPGCRRPGPAPRRSRHQPDAGAGRGHRHDGRAVVHRYPRRHPHGDRLGHFGRGVAVAFRPCCFSRLCRFPPSRGPRAAASIARQMRRSPGTGKAAPAVPQACLARRGVPGRPVRPPAGSAPRIAAAPPGPARSRDAHGHVDAFLGKVPPGDRSATVAAPVPHGAPAARQARGQPGLAERDRALTRSRPRGSPGWAPASASTSRAPASMRVQAA